MGFILRGLQRAGWAVAAVCLLLLLPLNYYQQHEQHQHHNGLQRISFALGAPDGLFGKLGRTKMVKTAVGKATRSVAGDLYDRYIRHGLFDELGEAQRELVYLHSPSPFVKIARAWQTAFAYQMRAARLPESWKAAAADLHKRLGGKGNLLLSLPPGGRKGRDMNMGYGTLQRAFISFALFFLNGFVPEEIAKCRFKTDNSAAICISRYERNLLDALFSTIVAFIQFIVMRAPGCRIASTIFVFAAVSPCPFGYLVEPAFIYGALSDSHPDLLKSLASIRRVASTKPCPDHKKYLLRALMVNGVTPGDIIRATGAKKDLGALVVSLESMVEAEQEALKDFEDNSVENILIDKDGDEHVPATKPLELKEELEEFLATEQFIHPAEGESGDEGENSMKQLSEAAITMFNSTSTDEAKAFLDRVRAVLGAGSSVKTERPELPFLDFQGAMEAAKEELKAEMEKNPHSAPLTSDKTADRSEQAEEALAIVRGGGLRAGSLFAPEEEKKGKSK